MNQRLQQAEHGEENRRWESPLVQPLTDHANERHRYDSDLTSDTVSRYGTDTERAWWQEQINGPRGVRLSAVVSFGLLHTLHALIEPVIVLLSIVLSTMLSGGIVAFYVISLVTTALVAVATGYVLRRITPRNALKGTAIAAAIEVGFTVFRGILYYWQRLPATPHPQITFYTLFWQTVVQPLLPSIIMVLTVIALAKYDRYKRSQER